MFRYCCSGIFSSETTQNSCTIYFPTVLVVPTILGVPNGRHRSGFWLVPENFCFFLPNQKAERRLPFGTCLVRHCPQGLFSPFFTFLRAIFFRSFRLSLAPTICPWASEDVFLPVFPEFFGNGKQLLSLWISSIDTVEPWIPFFNCRWFHVWVSFSYSCVL